MTTVKKNHMLKVQLPIPLAGKGEEQQVTWQCMMSDSQQGVQVATEKLRTSEL